MTVQFFKISEGTRVSKGKQILKLQNKIVAKWLSKHEKTDSLWKNSMQAKCEILKSKPASDQPHFSTDRLPSTL